MTCNERFNICSISGGRGLSRSGWYTSRPFSRVMAYPVPPLITWPAFSGSGWSGVYVSLKTFDIYTTS